MGCAEAACVRKRSGAWGNREKAVGCFGSGGRFRQPGADLIQRVADPADLAGIEGVVGYAVAG
jgi:hypothetical protein